MSKSIEIKRLKGKKLIDKLFKKGTTHHYKNVILKTLKISEENNTLYVGVSVPKRNFKRAVDRTRIKRQLRAALKEIESKINFTGACMLIYRGDKIIETKNIIKEAQVIFER